MNELFHLPRLAYFFIYQFQSNLTLFQALLGNANQLEIKDMKRAYVQKPLIVGRWLSLLKHFALGVINMLAESRYLGGQVL